MFTYIIPISIFIVMTALATTFIVCFSREKMGQWYMVNYDTDWATYLGSTQDLQDNETEILMEAKSMGFMVVSHNNLTPEMKANLSI